MKHLFTLFLILAITAPSLFSQNIGVKTNALCWATTSPNIGIEGRLNRHSTLSLTGSFNPFKFNSQYNDKYGVTSNSKIFHATIIPEYKYWCCRSFEKGFIGAHLIYSQYNAGGISILKTLKNHRYKGNALGLGLSLGYQWALGKSCGFETSLGAGYIRFDYKKYNSGKCGMFLNNGIYNYWGITKAAATFIYYLN